MELNSLKVWHIFEFMKRILVLGLLSISTLMCSAYPDSSTTVNTIFFKITSPDSQHTSYLFGTHHAFGSAFLDSLEPVFIALASTDVFISETRNDSGVTSNDIINNRREITHWRKYLSRKDEFYARSLLAKGGVDFDRLTPTELNVVLHRVYAIRNCKAKPLTDTTTSLDDYLGSLAKQAGMTRFPLETAQEQLELIRKDVDGMPRKVHRRRLRRLISALQLEEATGCAEVERYRQMEYNYQWSTPCTNSLVLTDRNNEWMKELLPLLGANDCFIAVGLSHLMFDCGLINQLREHGFTVIPVNLN